MINLTICQESLKRNVNVCIINGPYNARCPIHIMGPAVPVTTARACIQQLSEQNIPFGSCINHISMHFNNRDEVSVNNGITDQIQTKENHFTDLNICYDLVNACHCPTANCLNNIANGKCRDKFIIELIGKNFFADKYVNTNEKQR